MIILNFTIFVFVLLFSLLHFVEIRSVISTIVFGAILLAIFYHSIIYYYNRDKLLLNYLFFLFGAGLYVFFFTGLFKTIISREFHEFFFRNFAECTQILYLVSYSHFIGKALGTTKKKDPIFYWVWICCMTLFSFYAFFSAIYTLTTGADYHDLFLFSLMRVIGVLVVPLLLAYGFKLRNLNFERIILYGGVVYFVFLILSMVSQVFYSTDMLIYPPEWLIIGIFVDILFFSSALNYRNKLLWKEITKKRLEDSENIIKFQKVALQKQRDLENERNRIAADMHDDLGSELTKINYLSQMMLNGANTKENLEKIRQTTANLVQNMSNLIWAMKEENNSLQDLVSYIKIYSYDYLEKNGIKLSFSVEENLKDIEIKGDLRRNIYLSIKEILHNVVKHSGADLVEMKINFNENLAIKISDNGKGISKEDFRKNFGGNGLNNIKKRIEKIGGTSQLHSESGKTEHFFEIPVF